MPNPTLGILPSLTPLQITSAQRLSLTKTTDPELSVQWEYSAIFTSDDPVTFSNQNIKFEAKAGAAYSILSQSFFDPDNLVVYDDAGNAIYQDDGQLAYGFDHAFFVAPYSGIYYVNPSLRQGASENNKTVVVAIFEDSSSIKQPRNTITGTAGNDQITGTLASDAITGGDGLDTFVVHGNRSMYYVHGGNTVYVAGQSTYDGVDTLQGVERIQFDDVTMSFETTGIASQAYRLYQAAFDRKPDAGGLGFWIKAMGSGISLTEVASAFASSPEFAMLYGATPTNEHVLTALYKNVLHRAPDAGGHDFWLSALESHKVSLTDMLVSFSESAENQAQLIGVLQGGFEFTR
jgi:hypothetical protein